MQEGHAGNVAQRKRQQRDRLREAGLTLIEVWVPRQHKVVVRQLETLLRKGYVPELVHPYEITPPGERKMDLNLLQQSLNGIHGEDGIELKTSNADDGMVQVEVTDREEFPIVVTVDDEQIVCMTRLFGDKEVKEESRGEMLATMLELNLPMPLSSFGRINEQYVLFGALEANSDLKSVVNGDRGAVRQYARSHRGDRTVLEEVIEEAPARNTTQPEHKER